jgi:hypothetical protein
MMKRSTRGAAKVSIVWTIAGLVAFLVSLVLFFLTNQELTNQTATAQAAQKELKEYKDSRESELKARQELSTVVGFYDEGQVSNTDLGAVKEGLTNLRTAFPVIGEDVKSLSKALPLAIQAHASLVQQVKDQEEQLGSLRSDLETAGKTTRELAGQKDTEIADLRRQLADTDQSKSDLQTVLERQVAEAVENFKERDAKLIAARKAIEDTGRKAVQKEESLRTRLAEQGRKLNPFVKEPESPDGQVLEVSTNLNLGWINLGSENRLAMGTRFFVVSGLHGDNRVKAMAEVTRIKSNMAEVAFVERTDPFDPPAPGDVIFNPLFDPKGERHAMLIGRFSGALSEGELKALLEGMNIKVQKTLDKSTDFLIVGAEMYVDENGQLLSEPVQPTDLPIYRDAVAEGVQVVQVAELRRYFRF